MIELPDQARAQALFAELPPRLRLFTLSPAYCAADSRRDPALTPRWFAWTEGENFWLHAAHHGQVPNSPWHDLQSPYGYGGPVANCEDSDFLARAWTAWEEWCRNEGILAEFVRFHPMADNGRLYGGTVRDDRQTVAIPLTQPPLAGYSVRARTAVRKAIKAGIRARWLPAVEHAAEFGAFYRAGMAAIGADGSYLFGDDYFAALTGLPGAKLLVCEKDGAWLAAGLFLSNGQVMEYHLSATSPEGKSLSATNLLLHEAAETAHAAGHTWLYLGGGTDGRADNPLLFFKAGFSGQGFTFRIGWHIFEPAAYEVLKARWQANHAPSARVLFYRS